MFAESRQAISIAAGRLGMNRACEEPPDLSSRPEPDLEAANKLYGGMGMVGGSADGASGRGSGGGGMRPSRFGGGAGGGRFDDDDEGGLFLGLNHPDEPLPACEREGGRGGAMPAIAGRRGQRALDGGRDHGWMERASAVRVWARECASTFWMARDCA